MYALRKATEYVVKTGLLGDFVECGVWKGGSAMVIALTLLEMGESNRRIFLYDTFEGMSKPTNADYLISDKTAHAEYEWLKKSRQDHSEWAFSPINEVKVNLFSTGYPEDNLVFIKGKVEDTIPKTMPSKIALLRLDTDWYESTKHELIHLYPLLVQNGVLILDDYGHWAGAKKAVDEYLTAKRVSILLNRVDKDGRIGVKCEKL
jgi:hypothetical protein